LILSSSFINKPIARQLISRFCLINKRGKSGLYRNAVPDNFWRG